MIQDEGGWDEIPVAGFYTRTPKSLLPSPYILHPTPHTLNPEAYTLNPTPYTPKPQTLTLNPTLYTRHPKPRVKCGIRHQRLNSLPHSQSQSQSQS